MKLILPLIAVSLLCGGVPPPRSVLALPPAQNSHQTVEDERGIVALDQTLREITNPFTILCIAARPGDEDDGTLAHARKKLGARTVVLFATRGEGEDSWTRAELDRELGAVRTQEAIEAARVIGSDVLFLNLRDIGYSKSADEPLSIWGHDEALRLMVRAIRSARPDVIITNHNAKTGDGVEQAIARLALEAVGQARGAVPEGGSDPWAVRRFFERTDEAAATVKIVLNEYNPVRGMTYAQIGLAAHQRFVSRGANLDRLTPERESSYYRLLSSSSDEHLSTDPGLAEKTLRPPSTGSQSDSISAGLLGGLTLSENLRRSTEPPRVGDLGVVDAIATGDRLIEALIEKLIEKRAEGTADVMHERYGPEFVRVIRFTAALERAIALALGLTLEVRLSDPVVVPGQKVSTRIVLRNGGTRAFPVVFSTPESLAAENKTSAYRDSDVIGVGTGGSASKELEYEIASDATPTLPHAAHLHDDDFYAVGSTLPGAQPSPFGKRLVVFADVGLGQVTIRLGAAARFDVASPIEISTIPFALVRDWSTPRELTFPVRVRNRTPGRLAGGLWVVPLALADDNYDPVHIAFAREDEEVTITLKLRLPILKPPLTPDVLIEFRREKPASADVLGSAKLAVKAADFEIAEGLKIGYIRGLDDWLSFALTELGVEHSALNLDDISVTEHGNANITAQARIGCGDLSRFDTIIVDGSAFFAHPGLMRHNKCLLRYARQGGNLVVLSQRPDDWNLVLADSQFAPYPITLSRDRITVETSAVRILVADHPLTSAPNKITAKDFDGWVVERAANVPRAWSGEYTPLIESADPGEDPKQGILLVARSDEGTYIHTSLSFRRQLLGGNYGAYRLFADLISFPKVHKSPVNPK